MNPTHYADLRPREMLRRRLDRPVAYVPIGILEWHGYHNPIGLDAIKAERVVTYLAERLGGLVMPTLNWADNRAESVEVICDSAISEFPPADFGDHVTPICSFLGLSRARLEREATRSRENGGWKLWHEVVVHLLFQCESLGFELIVLYPGHHPMFSPARQAIELFRQRGGRTTVFLLTDHLVARGDHAAAFETSLLLALAPELVDLAQLSPDDRNHLGVVGADPLVHASAAAGRAVLEKFEAIVAEQISLAVTSR